MLAHEGEREHRVAVRDVGVVLGGAAAADEHVFAVRAVGERVERRTVLLEARRVHVGEVVRDDAHAGILGVEPGTRDMHGCG